MLKKRWTRVLAMVLSLCLIVPMTLAGCGNKTPEQAPEQTPDNENEFIQATEPEELGVAVDNDYMTFYYPKEWEGNIEEIRETVGKNMVVSFRTVISEKEVVLFSVIMGPEASEGYLVGQLEDAKAGAINVYTIVNEQNPDEWSAEDYDTICSLQERVNDIIVQFHEDERFAPIR